MLLVTLYGFFMKLPSETGSQSLRGIRAAVLPYDSVPADLQANIDQIQPLNNGKSSRWASNQPSFPSG